MKWLTVFFALFIILIIILADMDWLGPLKRVNQLPLGDKAGHFILYGILAFLINLTIVRSFATSSHKFLIISSMLILVILIGIEELSQQYFSSRTFSLTDLTASYLGVVFFSWLAVRVKPQVDL